MKVEADTPQGFTVVDKGDHYELGLYSGPGVEVFIGGPACPNISHQFRGNYSFDLYNEAVLLIMGEPSEVGGVGRAVAAYGIGAWWHVRYIGTQIYG